MFTIHQLLFSAALAEKSATENQQPGVVLVRNWWKLGAPTPRCEALVVSRTEFVYFCTFLTIVPKPDEFDSSDPNPKKPEYTRKTYAFRSLPKSRINFIRSNNKCYLQVYLIIYVMYRNYNEW